MKTNFYRKLDLLNRVYLVNFGAVATLDQGGILALPHAFELKLPARGAYLNLRDYRFLIFCLSRQKLNFVFRQVLVSALSNDPSLKLNGKLLNQLRPQLSKREFASILASESGTPRLVLNANLIRYTIDELTEAMQCIFFGDLMQVIPEQVTNRFGISEAEHPLAESLAPILTAHMVLTHVAEWLPNTFSFIESFNKHQSKAE